VRSTAALRGRAASVSGRVWVSRRLPSLRTLVPFAFAFAGGWGGAVFGAGEGLWPGGWDGAFPLG
jgi:hypothetical protein